MPDPVLDVSAIVDELGALQKELAPIKGKIDRAEALRKRLRSLYDGEPAAESFAVEGDRFAVAIGERGNERHITSMLRVFRTLKQAEFLRFCTFPLKHADERIAPFVEWRQTGPRTLKVTEKGNA